MTRASETPIESVTIMGLGLFGGGVACARWFAKRGVRVTVTDLRSEEVLRPSLQQLADLDLRTVLGRHEEEDFRDADLIVANPAVAPGNHFLEIARAAGRAITSELSIALRETQARLVLITGTQGKSSSASFAVQLLRGSGFEAHLLGNVGLPLLDQAEELSAQAIAVVEVSSYQLEALALEQPAPEVRAELVAVTNVLADHLERHGSVEAYAQTKASILKHLRRGGTALIDPGNKCLMEQLPADSRLIPFSPAGRPEGVDAQEPLLERRGPEVHLDGELLGDLSSSQLVGDFQKENLTRALGISRLLGAPAAKLRATVSSVEGLPHRLQDLGTHAGRRVIDNGVSTTPDSTLAAVLALPALGAEDVLLIGGRRKSGLPFAELARVLAQRSLRVICFGAERAPIAQELRATQVDAVQAAELEEAVACAFRLTQGVILFSPAAASFDAYANFRERAHHFERLVACEARSQMSDGHNIESHT